MAAGTPNRAAPSPRIVLPAYLQVEADPRVTLASDVMDALEHTMDNSGDAVPDGNAATAATAAHAVVAPDRRSSTATNSGGAAAAATASAAAARASHALGTTPPPRFTAGERERGVECSMVNDPTADALKPPYFLQAKHHSAVRATASAKQQRRQQGERPCLDSLPGGESGGCAPCPPPAGGVRAVGDVRLVRCGPGPISRGLWAWWWQRRLRAPRRSPLR